MPISRVRSVTDTSMMFITPMPPTRRLTAATERSSAESTPAIACCAWRNSACVLTLKSGSRPSGMRWRWRRIAVTCACARCVVSSDDALAISMSTRPGAVLMMRPRKLRPAHEAIVWSSPNGELPFGSSTPMTR
jgi:hypothetical protein